VLPQLKIQAPEIEEECYLPVPTKHKVMLHTSGGKFPKLLRGGDHILSCPQNRFNSLFIVSQEEANTDPNDDVVESHTAPVTQHS
jgi:hypothetical protein